MHTYDVLVVGAGPAGLLLAGDVARAGYSVAVVEKHKSINSFTRAFGINSRTLEVFAARGLAQQIIDQGYIIRLNRSNAIVTRGLDSFNSPFPFVLAIPQPLIDAELERYAHKCGAQVLRDCRVTDIQTNTDPIGISGISAAGEIHEFAARFVIAADGANSTIRKLMHIDFPGKTVFSGCALADIVIDPACITPELRYSPDIGRTKNSCAFLIPYGYGNKFRAAVWNTSMQSDDSAPVTDEELTVTLKECLRREIIITQYLAKSRFSSDERQIGSYRKGNVLFIGDAAHCHSPVGGQGLNTGVQDSANLSWKLSLVLAGAPDSILDTYHNERHPIGKRAIITSGLLLRANTPRDKKIYRIAFWLFRSLLRHSRHVQKSLTSRMSGLGLRYRHRNLAGDKHPLIGTRASVDTENGSIFDVLDGKTFIIVLDPTREKSRPTHGENICTVTYRKNPGPALLVRPDGYIAAVGNWEPELLHWHPHVSTQVSFH